jgi:hypothetical protein
MQPAPSPLKSNPNLAMKGWRLLGNLLLAALLVLLGLHLGGVVLDFVHANGYPFELDYGEGIVWQQAVLMPGPRAYNTSTSLPFIVFHYPPLYYLLVHAARTILPDYLAAGRLVASLATVPVALAVAGLVMIATRRPTRQPVELVIAASAGALVLCLHAFRAWGMLMRVDMPAVALTTTGLCVASWATGRFWGTTCALLLCTAAVFTKHSELPAGVAVFLVALLRNPRGALGAAAIAGAVGLAVLAFLQLRTGGGFLLNIVGYNVNPIWWGFAVDAVMPESSSLPVALLALIAAVFVGRSLLPAGPGLRLRAVLGRVRQLRTAEPPVLCRALLLLAFVLYTLTAPALMKEGSNYNYLLSWLAVGSTLIGIMLVELRHDASAGRWAWSATLLILVLTLTLQPLRLFREADFAQRRAEREALVQEFAAARKPVASDDMAVLMRAGKQVVYEPAIATFLAATGAWDQGPLVQFIRSGGFAYMLTVDNHVGGSGWRSPAVDAAMREAYPRVENVGRNLWLHLPAN